MTTPKQRLIEAVNEYKESAKDDLASAIQSKERENRLMSMTSIFDCNHFLKLIEEVLPNE